MDRKKIMWPDEETLKKMDRKLARVKGSASLPPNPTPVDVLKYNLCAQFILYKWYQDLTQQELAQLIGLSEARMSEILRYRYQRFTVDHLMKYLAKIKPDLKVQVA